MIEIEWQEPEPSPQRKYDALRAQLRKRPGEWAIVKTYDADLPRDVAARRACAFAANCRNRYGAWRGYEVQARKRPDTDEFAVYARWRADAR